MATLLRFEPFRELASLQSDMSRLMNGLLEGANGTGKTAVQQSWVPAVDVWETDEELVYAFDLPGIPEDRITVELEDGVLTVTGERERDEAAEGERFYRFERRFGSFQRALSLPPGVSEDGVKARHENGVLEVRVAKPAQPKPRRIPIGTHETATIEG